MLSRHPHMNRQTASFFGPKATPRSVFSAMLLPISAQPLLQRRFSATHHFSRYANAFAVSECRDSTVIYTCIQSYSDYISGTVLTFLTDSRSFA